MSYGFMGYTVDLAAITALVGSNDEGLRGALIARFKPDPSTQHALDLLLRGELTEGDASSYGYAFELLVRHLGQALRNRALSGCSPGYLEVADAALRAGGVTAISLEGLCYGTLPVELPLPNNFPGYGHLTAAQVVAADEQLAAFPEPADPYMREAAQELHSWTRAARAKGWGLIAFYY